MNLVIQTAGGVMLSVNTALLVALVFRAGRLVEKVEGMEKRITRIESQLSRAKSHGD